MDIFVKLIVLGILVEAITEVVKLIFVDGELNWNHLISIFIGITFSLAVGLDLLELLNLNSNLPFVGEIATGLIISRGSNAVHDILERIRGVW